MYATIRRMTPLTYGKAGMSLTEHFEADSGPVLTAYWDTFAKVWTIGYGHTGPDVHQGLLWTAQQCVDALSKDILWASFTVNRVVTKQLNQDQFDACVDFTFNDGVGSFERSTLCRLINTGNMSGADAEFAKWIYSGKNVVPGLVRRRAAEASLFCEVC